jgi:hypothetical protein
MDTMDWRAGAFLGVLGEEGVEGGDDGIVDGEDVEEWEEWEEERCMAKEKGEGRRMDARLDALRVGFLREAEGEERLVFLGAFFLEERLEGERLDVFLRIPNPEL